MLFPGQVRGLNFVSAEETEPAALLCLRVTAEADPSALARVLGPLHNINVIPRRVIAEFGTNDIIYIQVDIFGLTEERLSLIAGKLTQNPTVLRAYWHYP
jgi:hypothetical protein